MYVGEWVKGCACLAMLQLTQVTEREWQGVSVKRRNNTRDQRRGVLLDKLDMNEFSSSFWWLSCVCLY